MFSKKTKDFSVDNIDSIIGVGAVLEGNLETTNTTRIDGHIKGDVNTKGILVVGTTGKIEGKVHAQSVLVAGEISGDMHVLEKIEVSSSAKIMGDIRTKSLTVDEDAQFMGKCTMNIPNMEPEPASVSEE